MKQPDAAPPLADLGLIDDLVIHYRAFHALMAGVTLGVFDALASEGGGPRSAPSTAAQIKADPRATEILLDALASLGFVVKSGGQYRNSTLADHHLRSDSPASLCSNLQYQQLLAEPWAGLPQIIKTGHPAVSLPSLLGGHPEFVERYIEGMADISRRATGELADWIGRVPCVGSETHGNLRAALDVGGGGAVYAEALAQRNPKARITVMDVPSTLKVAASRLSDSKFRPQIELRQGDYHLSDFGVDAFDLVLFSHVLHDEGEEENKLLFSKTLRSLRPGGVVVIHDFMPAPDHAHPVFPCLFSVHMLIYTHKGKAYSADEYEAWLRDCGFVDPRRTTICPDRPTATTAILATRP